MPEEVPDLNGRNGVLGRVFRTTEEIEGEESGVVSGKIPEWMNGSFLRAGPGAFEINDEFPMYHIFDGFSILSKFQIDGMRQSVKFYKKFLRSDAYKRALSAGRPLVPEYGTRAYPDPSKSFFSKLLPNLVPPLSDNCNMSVVKLGNEVFASCETCYIRQFNPLDLGTGDKFDSTKLFGVNSLTCHPLTDQCGTVYNVGTSMLTGLKYNILKIPPASGEGTKAKDMLKKSKIMSSVSSSWNGLISFMHSFAITKNYILLIEQPYVFVASRVLGGAITKDLSIMEWLEWRPELKNNFLLIEKSSGKLIKTHYEAATPFFYLHIINAYEEKDELVIDISMFPDSQVLLSMTVENLRNANFHGDELQPYAARFVLPLVNISEVTEENNLISNFKTTATAVRQGKKIICSPEVLTPPGLEMPTINRDFIGRKNSYFYATGSATKGYFRNAITKVDAIERKNTLWRELDCYFVGEPIFVSSPKSTSEDDGVVLSCVIVDGSNEKEKNDFILILDAKTFKEIARVHFKNHIPQGVHGLYLPYIISK